MKYILYIQLRSFINRLNSFKFKDNFKTAVFLFISSALGVFLYIAAYRLLARLNTVTLAGPLIVNKLIALIFTGAFIMVMFSSVLTSFSTLYFSKDLRWLAASPIKINDVFSSKALSAFGYGAWMALAALIPFLIAVCEVKGTAAWVWAAAVILGVPFLAGASFTASIFAVVIMRFFPSAKTRNAVFITVIAFFTLVLMLLRFAEPEKLASSEGFEHLAQYLQYLNAPTLKFLPSWWYAGAIFSLLAKHYGAFCGYTLALLSFAVLMWLLLKFLAKKFYLQGLFAGETFTRAKKVKKFKIKMPGAFGAFIKKDLKMFFRDSGQWSQLLILTAIIAVYLFSIYKLSFETLKMHNTMSVVNAGLVLFVASAVSLRLAFPLVSLEGESLWLLLSAPVKRSVIFAEKLLLGITPVLVISLLLIYISNSLMKIHASVFILTFFAAFSACAAIGTSAVSIGAIMPKFNYSNIPEIESSLGGMVFILFSFFIIIINLALIAHPIKMFYAKEVYETLFISASIYVFIFNALVCAVMYYAGLKVLQNLQK